MLALLVESGQTYRFRLLIVPNYRDRENNETSGLRQKKRVYLCVEWWWERRTSLRLSWNLGNNQCDVGGVPTLTHSQWISFPWYNNNRISASLYLCLSTPPFTKPLTKHCFIIKIIINLAKAFAQKCAKVFLLINQATVRIKNTCIRSCELITTFAHASQVTEEGVCPMSLIDDDDAATPDSLC